MFPFAFDLLSTLYPLKGQAIGHRSVTSNGPKGRETLRRWIPNERASCERLFGRLQRFCRGGLHRKVSLCVGFFSKEARSVVWIILDRFERFS